MPLDPHEPVSALRSVPIAEGGEPLVDFRERGLRQDEPRFHYRRETVGRLGLVERLARADLRLKARGYRIAVLEMWRAPLIQRRMFRAVEEQIRARFPDLAGDDLREMVERYSAPMDDDVPPPHTTGGAVDLWLTDPDGKPHDLTSPFEWRDPAGFAFDADGLTPLARANRDRLRDALEAEGVTNYPSEFWHWSYGDQGWAYRGGRSAAIYGAVQPEGWLPDPADDTDAPLAFTETV